MNLQNKMTETCQAQQKDQAISKKFNSVFEVNLINSNFFQNPEISKFSRIKMDDRTTKEMMEIIIMYNNLILRGD